MNIFKKVYCRAFQGIFRIALPILPYRDPVILDSTNKIAAAIKNKNLKRPLLVTDKTIKALGLTCNLEKNLCDNDISVFVYDETDQNPTSDMVHAALDVYRENNCDCIIAFGGGSPIDCAKVVGACIARPDKTLDKMAGIIRVLKKTPPIFAIPTTAGTGSETTLAAVIVDSQTRHKYVINDFVLIPSYAVLDAHVIKTLPSSVVAATGMDALTHAVEAYIGRSTTKQTRKYAEDAVKIIFENIKSASNHESSDAENKMLYAAHLAGRAFTRSYVGYVHAVSHSLSGKYNIAHGQTNAILLPIVLEMYQNSIYKKLAKLCICADLGNIKEDEKILAKRFITKIYELNEILGIPKNIDCIQKEDIALLARYASEEANPLYPVPVLWDKKELENIYRKVMV